MFFFAIVVAAASAAAIYATLFILKRQITSSVGVERESLIAQIPQTLQEVEKLLASSDQYASKPQLDFVVKQVDVTKADIQKEKDNLKSIETRLETAQKNVEEKEAAQQELKTAKEEDEIKLQELLGKFDELSGESISLEQRLASSMKNLDTLMTEVEMTPDQKGVFMELSNALTEAGSRVRELLMEYTTVKERLQVLGQQHSDLEDEYTRLVEQQLGE